MRRCFYHTDLGQNAVVHNLQYKLHSFNIQDDGCKTIKKISKITNYGQPVLTFD